MVVFMQFPQKAMHDIFMGKPSNALPKGEKEKENQKVLPPNHI
jgi:hypothetical protein